MYQCINTFFVLTVFYLKANINLKTYNYHDAITGESMAKCALNKYVNYNKYEIIFK